MHSPSSSSAPQLPQLYLPTRPLSGFLNFKQRAASQDTNIALSDASAPNSPQIPEGQHEQQQYLKHATTPSAKVHPRVANCISGPSMMSTVRNPLLAGT